MSQNINSTDELFRRTRKAEHPDSLTHVEIENTSPSQQTLMQSCLEKASLIGAVPGGLLLDILLVSLHRL